MLAKTFHNRQYFATLSGAHRAAVGTGALPAWPLLSDKRDSRTGIGVLEQGL